MNLNLAQREQIFERTCRVVQKHYFDPNYNGKDWPALARARKATILQEDDPVRFEKSMHELVRELGTSHTGFFHEALRRVPARLAVSATFRKWETPDGARWMFQDVHEGGPAHSAGITPTDLLLSINDDTVLPPQQPTVPMDATVSARVRKNDGRESTLTLAVPSPRWRRQPFAEPRSVSFKRIDGQIGYLKAAIFPGFVGIDVARELDKSIAALSDCDRLIIDLRGHLGGGLGGLRLMSYLTPDRIPVGYSVTRRRAEHGFSKDSLPRFGSIPRSKSGIPLLALRFAGRDESVVLVTEGLGRQRFHGRIILLVNEHTASAGEMICAFAAENKLATILGTQTAGRLLGGKGFKAGHGYLVILPGAAFYTWGGESFEGHGVAPNFDVPWSAEAVLEGRDNQLEEGIEAVRLM